jgi:DcmR-like sensory protein
MVEAHRQVRLAGALLQHSRHVCAFFHTADEAYEILLPFILEGIEQGELAFHIVDPAARRQHLDRLQAAGLDAAAALARGQLEVRVWQDAHLRDTHFDQQAMLALVEEILDHGKARGFPLTRLIAQMEWALEDCPGVNDLLEYEARLNELLPRYQDPVVCTYDLARFGGGLIIDILRTHPLVIIGGILQENPFFVPPEELLRELRPRQRPQTLPVA